jgi:hypothetical protein
VNRIRNRKLEKSAASSLMRGSSLFKSEWKAATMKKSPVLQFRLGPVRAEVSQDPPLAKRTSHECLDVDKVHVRDEKSFQRFLEAANNLGSHLTNIFDDAFLQVLSPARKEGSHSGADTRVVAPIQLRSRKTRTVEPTRIYMASFVGQLTGSQIVEASSDREAIEKARRLLDCEDIELWAGERLIARLNHSRPWPARPWQAALMERCRPSAAGHPQA